MLITSKVRRRFHYANLAARKLRNETTDPTSYLGRALNIRSMRNSLPIQAST